MDEPKGSFLFYRSYIDVADKLPPDRQYSFIRGIIGYALDRTTPNFSGAEDIAFTLMKANIDSCNKRYSASVNNGKKGGRPTKNWKEKNPRKTQHKPNQNPNENDNVNDNSHSVSCVGGLTAPPTPRKDDENGREIDANGWRKILE